MITAVDTSVLIDVFGADPHFGAASANALRLCLNEGAVVASEAVWGETRAAFGGGRRIPSCHAGGGDQLFPDFAEDGNAGGRHMEEISGFRRTANPCDRGFPDRGARRGTVRPVADA